MEYVLTEPGRQKIADYILQCAAKRKEILDAGIDTADATKLPTEEDVLSDLNYGAGVDEDGDYYNCWGVTDGYNSDYPLGLEAGKDFIEKETMLRIAEIEATLANEEYENEVEECCLEIELQLLQGSKNAYNEPYAFIGTDNVSFDVSYTRKKTTGILLRCMTRMEIRRCRILMIKMCISLWNKFWKMEKKTMAEIKNINISQFAEQFQR